MRPPHYRARKSENQRERERETLFGQIFQRDGSVGAQFGVVGC
jgi:hypothetical protein